MIVSRFTTFTENFVICCYRVTKIFQHGGTASPWRILHGALVMFGPFTDLAISVFWEMSTNTVLTPNPHVSRMWALKKLHEKNWRVSLCVLELCHPRDFLWILAAVPENQKTTGRSVPYRGFRFYLVLDFWLAWSTGRPVLFVQHVHLTQVLDGNLIPLRSSRARVSLSLDTVVVGEVDELEEDVGWSINLLVLNVSLMLKNENWRKNSMTSQEPR